MSLLTPKLTNNGMSMIVAALDGDSITFTKAVIGNTTVAPENPEQLIDVVSPMITAEFTNISIGPNFVTLAAVFTNIEVETGAYASELGLYAKDSSGTEKLYAYTCVEENADYIPAAGTGRTVTNHMTIVVAIGNAEEVDAVLVDSSAYATREDLIDHIHDYDNPHRVTKEIVGLEKVENEYFVDNAIVVDQLTSAANITTGDTLRQAMSKIWYWIQKIVSPGFVPISGYGNAGNAWDGVGMTGDIWFQGNGNNPRGIGGHMSQNDAWRMIGAGDSSISPSDNVSNPMDCGYLEIATADNGVEPIVARQYTSGNNSVFNRVVRTAYLLNASGNTVFPGSCTATSHPTSSDLKKKDVHGGVDLQTAEALIMGLQPIFYNFKGGWKESAGFGAQDVYKLAHKIGLHDNGMYRAAKMPDKDGNAEGIEYHDADIEAHDDADIEWNLNYTEFIPYLVKVVQDQQMRLDDQQKRIEALEEEIRKCLQ